MFVLAELKDNLRIAPDKFTFNLVDAVRDEINRKLSNKVLLDVGLCIALKDILSIKDSIILPGDGAAHTEVLFRYVVFRPTIGNIITGKIRSCSRAGVHVTLGFFDDILIPPTGLQHPSRFEEAEQAWVWEYPLEDGAKHDLYMDVNESIKFRVVREVFEDTAPVKSHNHNQSQEKASSTAAEQVAPYKIIAGINESGLGVLSWWEQQNADENEEIADEECDETDNIDDYDLSNEAVEEK